MSQHTREGVRTYFIKGVIRYNCWGDDHRSTRQLLKCLDREWEDEYEDDGEQAPRRPRRTRRQSQGERSLQWSLKRMNRMYNGYDHSDPFPYSNPKTERHS